VESSLFLTATAFSRCFLFASSTKLLLTLREAGIGLWGFPIAVLDFDCDNLLSDSSKSFDFSI
jgi:hypothetical protein